MDWKDIGPIVGAIAPFAGKVIGGIIPIPGAAIAGELLGKAIGSALGVPADKLTPQNVSDALVTATEETKRAAINAAMEQARAQIEGFAEVEKAYVEATRDVALGTQNLMRVELEHQSLFYTGWRPFIGWVFGVTACGFGLMLTFATGTTALHSPDPISVLRDAWPLFLAYFGPLGLAVGVLIPSRSAEKIATISKAPDVVVAPKPDVKITLPKFAPGGVVIPKPQPGSRIIPEPPGSRT